LFLAQLPGLSAIWMKIIDTTTSRLLLTFSGKFPAILNFRKIYNPTNSRARKGDCRRQWGCRRDVLCWTVLKLSCS